MAPRKLSDSDKRQITSTYCQPGETTSTLANKFGISSSTVSRVLKQVLPDDEYTKLMKWKRSGERGSFPLASSAVVEQLDVEVSPDDASSTLPEENEPSEDDLAPEAAQPEPVSAPDQPPERQISRRSRRRSTASAAPAQAQEASTSTDGDGDDEPEVKASQPVRRELPLPARRKLVTADEQPEVAAGERPDADAEEAQAVAADEGQEVAAWVSEGFEEEGDYDEDADEDWDEENWEEDTDEEETTRSSVPQGAELTIHSFDAFELTKPCYLVVDRLAELITCPLKDFSELGIIPAGEEQAKTLPVFDNHRIARRFARRNQKIIKVPDGVMLNKTQDYLQAKGITRILFDGQVYALSY